MFPNQHVFKSEKHDRIMPAGTCRAANEAVTATALHSFDPTKHEMHRRRSDSNTSWTFVGALMHLT